MQKEDHPPSSCPDCGAVLEGDLTCRAVFDEFLALELTDPGYGAVHLLTVACYMIQHRQYSDVALAWVQGILKDTLEKGLSAEEIRRQSAGETNQGRRKWKVTRRHGDPPQAKIPWSMTIVDVARNYQDVESYRELVKQWARTTLQEMQPLLDPPEA